MVEGLGNRPGRPWRGRVASATAPAYDTSQVRYDRFPPELDVRRDVSSPEEALVPASGPRLA